MVLMVLMVLMVGWLDGFLCVGVSKQLCVYGKGILIFNGLPSTLSGQLHHSTTLKVTCFRSSWREELPR